MRGAVALPLVLALAASSCGPSEAGDDDEVDAGGDALVTGREFNVDCTPETREIRYADGRVDVATYWFAYVDQPFDWHAVEWRVCNPAMDTQNPACPAGATCTGTVDLYPFCRSGVGIEQLTGGADRGRVQCGYTFTQTTAAGVTTTTGNYFRLAQIHID